MPKYLDPKADVVFKKIFGEHPILLKSFLNAILPLPDDGQIDSLEYLAAEQIPTLPVLKRTIVDVKCTDEKGRVFIVEMQMEWINGFMQRMLFNSAAAYIKQLQKGEDYEFLCPVYGLGIIADIFDSTTPAWYHHYQIVNVQNPAKQLKGLELVFLELPKFKPSTKKEKRLRVLWLRFLSELNEQTREVASELLQVPEIRQACDLSEQAAYTPGELAAYDAYWDHVSTTRTLANGHYTAGRKAGHAEGHAEGRVEGKAEGMRERNLEIAKNLLGLNLPSPDVATATGLSLAEIEALNFSSAAGKNQ